MLALPDKIALSAFPTRSSFGTAYRERPDGLSHFEQTLNPGMPGLPVRELLSKLLGSGLFVSREPHLPRIHFLIFFVLRHEFSVKKKGTKKGQKLC